MSDDRYILVVADNSEEMNTALEYACARSKKTGRKIIIATFIEPLDVLTTKGVTDIMKEEAREEAETILKKAASFVQERTGDYPALSLREGDTIVELKQLLDEEKNQILMFSENIFYKEWKKNNKSFIITIFFLNSTLKIFFIQDFI